MAASIIGGLCKQGISPTMICASDPGAAQLQTLHSNYGVRTTSDNGLAVRDADIIVLAVKPQVMRQVCEQLAPHIHAQQLSTLR